MIIYGKQVFLYVLNKHPQLIKEVFLSKDIDKKIFSKLKKLNIKITKVDNKKAQALAKGGNHQGFLAKVEDFKLSTLQDIKDKNFIIVLAGITDMGNIGSIIRSSYALGVDAVVISLIKDIKLSTIARTSSGALFDMPLVIEKDIGKVLNELKQKGFYLYCANIEGEDVRDVKFAQKKVLVLGNEGEGLSNKVLKKCHKKIKISMEKEFDSLNVSVACAILCDRMRNGREFS